MALGAVVEAMLRPILEIAFQVFGDLTGRVVVPLFSFGYFRVEGLTEGKRPRPSMKRQQSHGDQPGVISADAGAFWGVLFWIAIGVGGYLVRLAVDA